MSTFGTSKITSHMRMKEMVKAKYVPLKGKRYKNKSLTIEY